MFQMPEVVRAGGLAAPRYSASSQVLRETKGIEKADGRFHVNGLREDDLPIPQPTAICEYVET